MNLTALIDEQGLRYRDFMSAITGSLLLALSGGSPHSPSSSRLFRDNLERMTLMHIEQVSRTIRKHVQRVTEASLSESLVTLSEKTKGELLSYTEQLTEDAITRRGAQMASEAGRARREHSNAVWHMQRLIEAGATPANALASTRERYLMSREGQFTDSQGRQWRGTRFVQVEAHSLVYRIWNQTMVTAAIAGGLSEVYLVHPEKEPVSVDPMALLEDSDYLKNPVSRTRVVVDA